jgi:hypothetical protein
VIPAANDFDQLVILRVYNAINQAMFARDPAGPPSVQFSPQRFRPTEPPEWVTRDIGNQDVDLP